MKFIDRAVVTVRAGKGGDGIASFARTRFNPRGGPDGANGGKGGSVILKVVGNKSTLIDFEYKSKYNAPDGNKGVKGLKTGKDGKDIYINLPPGVIIYNNETNQKIIELTHLGEEFTIAHGGNGGLGNTNFKTAGHRTPLKSTKGSAGEEFELLIELKLLADLALVGMPNAGKSTIISRISKAKPKIADYPFTTLVPNVGVVKFEEDNFVVADIPGLVEGASAGVGLGIGFLKHIERCTVIAHVVDVTENDIFDKIKLINKELANYSNSLVKKQQFFIFNKMDALQGEKQKEVEKLADLIRSIGLEVIFISAVTGKNITNLTVLMHKLLKQKKRNNKLLLFGGSFDPPHKGHKALIKLAQNITKIDKTIIFPCYLQALKEKHSQSAEERLAYLKLFIQKEFDQKNKIFISNYEILKKTKTYTIETIEFLEVFYPSVKFYFVMGLDSFNDIMQWKEYKKLLRKINLIVFNRNGYYFNESLENLKKILKENKIIKLNTALLGESGIKVFKGREAFNYIYYVDAFNEDVSSRDLRRDNAVQESE